MDSSNKTINQYIKQFIIRVKKDSQFRAKTIAIAIVLLSSLYFGWHVVSSNIEQKKNVISREKQSLKTEELAVTYDENQVSEKDFSDILFTLEGVGINKELIQLAREKNDLNVSLSGSTLLGEAMGKQNTDLIQLLVERGKVDTKEEYYTVEKQLNGARDRGQKILLGKTLQMLFYQRHIADDEVLKLRSIINSIGDIAGKRALINRLDTTRDFNFIVESSYYETKYPLEIAFAENNEPLIELLLNNGAEINDSIVGNIMNRSLTIENEKTFSKYFLEYYKKSEYLKTSTLSLVSQTISKDLLDYFFKNGAKLGTNPKVINRFINVSYTLGEGNNQPVLDYLSERGLTFDEEGLKQDLISYIYDNNVDKAENILKLGVKLPITDLNGKFRGEKADKLYYATMLFLFKNGFSDCGLVRYKLQQNYKTSLSPIVCSSASMQELLDAIGNKRVKACLSGDAMVSPESENLYNLKCTKDGVLKTTGDIWKESNLTFP